MIVAGHHKSDAPTDAGGHVVEVEEEVAWESWPKPVKDSRLAKAGKGKGGVEPDSNKGIVAPLAMGLLAASALHDDEASLGHATSASNGFGLIFRLVAVASGSKTFGGVVGGIAAVRTVYSRFLAHGNEVRFPRNSEIEIELARRDSPRTRP